MKTKRKFRRKTLKQWAAFVRKGQKAKAYEADHRLHDFEDEVILRKWLESGEPTISAKRLAGLYPNLFDPSKLPRAMKRMAKQGTIERAGNNRFTGGTYRLKKHGAHRARRAA